MLRRSADVSVGCEMTGAVAFFGGTFDPVHLGHIHAARQARQALQLAELRMVLAAQPSHRDAPHASAADRWTMLCLALREEPGLIADDREIAHGAPSYTVETLDRARAEYGADRPLIWLVGWDAFCQLHRWRQWQQLPELAHLVILRRPGQTLEMPEPVEQLCASRQVASAESLNASPAGAVYILEAQMLDISATAVRLGVCEGTPVSHLLPAPVWTYISERQLYRGTPH